MHHLVTESVRERYRVVAHPLGTRYDSEFYSFVNVKYYRNLKSMEDKTHVRSKRRSKINYLTQVTIIQI
jgi:hypothetical protein